jgi:phage/plasmid-like protein (TIGR03299 family)
VAHELELLADGSTAFAAAREPGWHRLGTVAPGPMTAQEVLDLAHLSNWNIRKSLGITAVVPGEKCQECRRKVGAKHTQKCPVPQEPDRASDDLVVSEEDTAQLLPVDGWVSTYRTTPVTGELQPLGIVSNEYPVIQPEEFADFMQAIVDTSGAVFDTGGSLRNGRDIFLTMQLPQAVTIGGVDEIGLYMAGFNNYSGQGKLKVVTTPVRVVCANTERAALRNFRSEYTFRHSSGLAGRLQEAREALRINFEFTDAFKAEAESMINAKMNNDQFGDLIKAVWPDKFSKPLDDWKKPQHDHWESLQGLFKSADTQENIRHTAWAGYNSITEYLDWEIPIPGVGGEQAATARADRAFLGQYNSLKHTAFSKALDFVAAQ